MRIVRAGASAEGSNEAIWYASPAPAYAARKRTPPPPVRDGGAALPDGLGTRCASRGDGAIRAEGAEVLRHVEGRHVGERGGEEGRGDAIQPSGAKDLNALVGAIQSSHGRPHHDA